MVILSITYNSEWTEIDSTVYKILPIFILLYYGLVILYLKFIISELIESNIETKFISDL